MVSIIKKHDYRLIKEVLKFIEPHISDSAKKIYSDFKLIEELKIDLSGHFKNVNRILALVLKEPWKYDYPEHVDEFKKLKSFIIGELVKEINFIKSLADLMCNNNGVIEILKYL